MPRKRLIRTHEFPYHVTARCNNQEDFHLPKKSTWFLFCQVLKKVEEVYKVEITSFVLMSNHFHMIVRTPNSNLDSIMNYILREVSRKSNRKTSRSNHLFGRRYHWSLIESDEYLYNVYKYTYRNPVACGITLKSENYPFSTLFFVSRNLGLPFKIHEAYLPLYLIPKDMIKRLQWLNEAYTKKQAELLQKALKRKTFRYPEHRLYRKTSLSLIPNIFLYGELLKRNSHIQAA